MPRKKLFQTNVDLATPTIDNPPTPEAKPKTNKVTKKTEVVVEVAPVVKPTPSPAAKPAPRRKPAAKAAPEPVPAPVVAEKPVARSARKLAPKVAAAAEAVVHDDVPTPTFRSRKPKTEVEVAAPVAEIKKPARGRGRVSKAEPNPFVGVDADLPMPSFRPSTGAVGEEGEGSGEPNLAPRKSRRRRRGEPEVEITATGPVRKELTAEERIIDGEAPEESLKPVFRKRAADTSETVRPAVAKPAAEERAPRGRARTAPVVAPVPERRLPPPPKPLIPVPDDAPQVVLRDGVPTLVRKGRVYPPIWFFGSSPDERRTRTVMEELGMAAEAGIHLHSHLIEFEVDKATVAETARLAAFLLAQTLKVDPEAQVLFRIVFLAPRGWQNTYPSAAYTDREGHLAEPSVCDDAFWGVAKDCLNEFVRSLRMLDQRESILGVHLERGEWFFSSQSGYDESEAAKKQFREWARSRYTDDEVALRANWFDGTVRFDTISIPRRQDDSLQGERFVRSSRKQRRYVDYHLFLSDATVNRIADLAYSVKESSEGYFVVGCSYGYTFEWSHPASGHLSLGKLLRTPEIDMIAGPPSYKNREPGSTAPFPGPVDSFALNGKLFVSEEDFKTSLSIGAEPDDFNPMIKTPQALDSVHWRGAGAALAHGTGVSWMDLWGNGWLKTHSVWDRAQKIQRSMIMHMAAPLQDPEVIVFIDERALGYLVDEKAFELLVQNARESVLRAGVNAGFYLLSDLAHRERFPEAKVYMFLNAWDIRPELRAAIKTRLQRDNKVLFWLYSAGLFDAGRESLERAREVTGIALKPQPFHSRTGTTILNRRHPLSEAFPSSTIAGTQQLEPSYFAIPEDATVLGEYSQTGLPSFVVKDFKPDADGGQAWTSVFLGEPVINPALVRALAQMAGAHVYNFNEDVVHVRPPFLTVHCAGAGARTVTLPNKWHAFNLLSGQWMTMESTNMRFTATDGSTHVFLVGSREEIETLLLTNPDDLLHMAELPPRSDNIIRQDSIAFDVPIMKLDEWIEGGEPDEVADEWFLRPTALADIPESTEEADADKIGRRRRRRRGRGPGDRGGSDDISTSRSEGGSRDYGSEVSLNVMFRKRD